MTERPKSEAERRKRTDAWFLYALFGLLVLFCGGGPLWNLIKPSDPAPTNNTTTTTTAAPAPLTGESTCTDPKGDGKLGGDLSHTNLSSSDASLIVTWGATPPPGPDRSYYVAIGHYQLGYKVIGAERVGFVFDLNTNRNVDLPLGARMNDKIAQLKVPWAEIQDLKPGASWTATLTDGATDLDECKTTWPAR